MASATRIYIIMLGTFAVGIWAILSFGSIFLSAPRDLSGLWELRSADAPLDAPPTHTLQLDQSGWYCRIVIDGDRRHPLDLKRQTPRRDAQSSSDTVTISLAGSGMNLTFSAPTVRRDEYSLTGSGALEGAWNAIRTDAAHASRAASRGGTTRPESAHVSH